MFRLLISAAKRATVAVSRNFAGGSGCGSTARSVESSVRQQATLVSRQWRPVTPRPASSARAWSRPPSSMTAATFGAASTVGCKRESRKARTSASRASAHSWPTRSHSRRTCVGLMAMSANSLRSLLASANEAALPARRTAIRTIDGLKPSCVSCNCSSRGEKHDPTGRATPFFSGQFDGPGPGGQDPSSERVAGFFHPASGLLTLAARRGFDGPGVGCGLHALLQEPRLQIARQLRGLFLDAVEGGQGHRGVFGKEAVENGVDVFVQLAADVVAVRRREWGRHS